MALTTEIPANNPGFFRTVARLGIQAAEALDHAHEMGIVHRDIKPGNLLVDARGNLWITDFGLAQFQRDVRLTLTGDVVGTLRYMSPEQALAKRVVIDHRSDIYSLGATLYELLTLEPVFNGRDREELLRQIAFEEPQRPRRLNRAIPAELETIVLKSLEKNPQDRYGTAQELADDLRCFLEDRPMKARRPSWRKVAARWVRRHRPVVWATTVVLVLAAVLGGGNWLWSEQKREAADREAEMALRETERWQKEGKWPEALAAVRPAKALADGGAVNPELAERVRKRLKDLEMVAELDEIRLRQAAVKDDHFDDTQADFDYEKAFRELGIDVTVLGRVEAAPPIQARRIRLELAAGLDAWAFVRETARKPGDTTWKDLLALARAVDPDEWRTRLRNALEARDQKALKNRHFSLNANA